MPQTNPPPNAWPSGVCVEAKIVGIPLLVSLAASCISLATIHLPLAASSPFLFTNIESHPFSLFVPDYLIAMARDKVDDAELNAQEKNHSSQSPSSSQEFSPNGEKGEPLRKHSTVQMKLKNPLADISYDELMADVESFAKRYDMEYCLDDLQKGALVSQNKSGFEHFERLTAEDKTLIREEKLHRWRQPKMMYYMTSTLCFGFVMYLLTAPCKSSALDPPSCKAWTSLRSMALRHSISHTLGLGMIKSGFRVSSTEPPIFAPL